MRACFLVKLGVEFIKLPEFRRAQFRTSFLIANYDTEYYHQKRRQYILITFLWLADVLCRPTSMTYYESWPPRIASYLCPKHLLFFVYYLVLFWSAAHQMPHKSIWIISYSLIILMNSNNNSIIDNNNNITHLLRDQIKKVGIK
jgi:hypothetical protein